MQIAMRFMSVREQGVDAPRRVVRRGRLRSGGGASWHGEASGVAARVASAHCERRRLVAGLLRVLRGALAAHVSAFGCTADSGGSALLLHLVHGLFNQRGDWYLVVLFFLLLAVAVITYLLSSRWAFRGTGPT
jgi:hypothetical protein